MRECAEDGEPVTIEEAREMAELELKARGVNHTTSEEGKPRKPKVRKVDKVKAEILSEFEKALTVRRFGRARQRRSSRRSSGL